MKLRSIFTEILKATSLKKHLKRFIMAVLRSLLLLFTVFSMGNAEVGKCPSGWTKFGDACYKYFSQTVNWVTAEKNCQSVGGNLASVHNKLENDLLLGLVPNNARAWVGGQDGEQEGQWIWSDGSAFEFTNWCSGEPNNWANGENCLELAYSSNRCWNDCPCSTPLAYVCVTGV